MSNRTSAQHDQHIKRKVQHNPWFAETHSVSIYSDDCVVDSGPHPVDMLHPLVAWSGSAWRRSRSCWLTNKNETVRSKSEKMLCLTECWCSVGEGAPDLNPSMSDLQEENPSWGEWRRWRGTPISKTTEPALKLCFSVYLLNKRDVFSLGVPAGVAVWPHRDATVGGARVQRQTDLLH